MTNAELFNDPVEDVANLPIVDPSKNYFEELVGEGKKFKDPASLALGKVQSDRHIAKLESELKALRTDLNSRTALEELVTKISSVKPSDSGTPVGGDSGSNQNASTQLTPEDLAKLVDERVSQLSAREQAKVNLNTVKSALKEAWGAEFPAKLREKAAELGVGESFLNDLAASQPKAFLKLVEAEKPANPVGKDTGAPLFGRQVDSSRQSSAPVSDAGFRGKSYYNKLRAESPSKFWDPKVQLEMNEMAMRDPEKYLAS